MESKPASCELCLSHSSSALCGKCLLVSYCSRECQKKHWDIHKSKCKLLCLGKTDFDKFVTSVYELYKKSDCFQAELQSLDKSRSVKLIHLTNHIDKDSTIVDSKILDIDYFISLTKMEIPQENRVKVIVNTKLANQINLFHLFLEDPPL